MYCALSSSSCIVLPDGALYVLPGGICTRVDVVVGVSEFVLIINEAVESIRAYFCSCHALTHGTDLRRSPLMIKNAEELNTK